MLRPIHALLFGVLSATASANPTQHFDYIDLAYSKQNTDWHNYGDSDTATVKAGISFWDFIHFRARYNAGNAQLPARNAQQDEWWAYGVGLHLPVGERTWLTIGSDHNELKLKNDLPTERGWYHHIGIRHSIESWQLGLGAGETDVIFRDTTFAAEAVYSLTNYLGLSATLRDYDDLDLTEYELGLRWFFR